MHQLDSTVGQLQALIHIIINHEQLPAEKLKESRQAINEVIKRETTILQSIIAEHILASPEEVNQQELIKCI